MNNDKAKAMEVLNAIEDPWLYYVMQNMMAAKAWCDSNNLDMRKITYMQLADMLRGEWTPQNEC
jgi:hypothetical protein